MIDKIISNKYFIFITGLCSVIGVLGTFISENSYVKAFVGIVFAIMLFILIWRAISLIIKVKKFDDVISIIEKQNTEYKKCFSKIQSSNLSEYEFLDSALIPYVNSIAELMDLIPNKKGCICIKMIETESLMNEDYEKWKVKTIARSQSTKPKRMKNDNSDVFVYKNSDFCDMIIGNFNLSPFIVPDLPDLINKRINTDNPYKNSTRNYLEQYKSTMVFPIFTQKEYVSTAISNRVINDNNTSYHIIGFLCWDYKEVYTDKETFSKAAEVLETFADMLYPLLESYIVKQLQVV